jgi:hypothetical protein
MRTKLALLSAPAALLVLASTACGGDDDDEATAFDAGSPVVCDTLSNESYTYNAMFQFTVEAPEVRPTGVPPGPESTQFTQDIAGEHEDADSFKATTVASDTFREYPAVSAVYDDGRVWTSNPTGWTEQPPRERLGDNIPYRPVDVCTALAPDIDTTWDTESEEINGVDSHRFDVEGLVSDFPDRSPGLGGGADIAQLVNEFDGSIWVAEDGAYVTKMELTGSGTYPDGTALSVIFAYEITEMDADIDIAPPA